MYYIKLIVRRLYILLNEKNINVYINFFKFNIIFLFWMIYYFSDSYCFWWFSKCNKNISFLKVFINNSYRFFVIFYLYILNKCCKYILVEVYV